MGSGQGHGHESRAVGANGRRANPDPRDDGAWHGGNRREGVQRRAGCQPRAESRRTSRETGRHPLEYRIFWRAWGRLFLATSRQVGTGRRPRTDGGVAGVSGDDPGGQERPRSAARSRAQSGLSRRRHRRTRIRPRGYPNRAARNGIASGYRADRHQNGGRSGGTRNLGGNPPRVVRADWRERGRAPSGLAARLARWRARGGGHGGHGGLSHGQRLGRRRAPQNGRWTCPASRYRHRQHGRATGESGFRARGRYRKSLAVAGRRHGARKPAESGGGQSGASPATTGRRTRVARLAGGFERAADERARRRRVRGLRPPGARVERRSGFCSRAARVAPRRAAGMEGRARRLRGGSQAPAGVELRGGALRAKPGRHQRRRASAGRHRERQAACRGRARVERLQPRVPVGRCAHPLPLRRRSAVARPRQGTEPARAGYRKSRQRAARRSRPARGQPGRGPRGALERDPGIGCCGQGSASRSEETG